MKTIARIHDMRVWLYTMDSAGQWHTLAVLEGEPKIELSEYGDKWYIHSYRGGNSTGAIFADCIEKGDS